MSAAPEDAKSSQIAKLRGAEQPPARREAFAPPAGVLGNVTTAGEFFEKMKPSLSRALGDIIGVDRFVTTALLAINGNPKILECSRDSVFQSLMTSASLGLEIGGPMAHGHLVPYAGKCTFQVGYPGWITLAYRSGHVKLIDVDVVCPGDRFTFKKGVVPVIEHELSLERDEYDWTHVYALVVTTSGGTRAVLFDRREVHKHRDRSKGWQNAVKHQKTDQSPWVTDEPAMAKKTAVINVLKMFPRAVERVQESIRFANEVKTSALAVASPPMTAEFMDDSPPASARPQDAEADQPFDEA